MATLAASAYFLTCCRPAKKSTFCFYVEPPKFINLHSHLDYAPNLGEIAVCDLHKKLSDHSLNAHTSCTDDRAWSQDNDQRRRHFLDITNKHIPLCGVGSQEAENTNPDEIQSVEDGEKSQHVTVKPEPTKKPKEKTVEQEKQTKQKKIEGVSTPVNQILGKPIKPEEKGKEVPSPINQKQKEPSKGNEIEKEEPSPESEISLPEKSVTKTKPTDEQKEKDVLTPPSSEFDKALAEESLAEIEPDTQKKKEKDVPPPPTTEPKKSFTEISFTDIDLTPTKEVLEKPQTRAENRDAISDDIIEKLDFNLLNLEETFDKFVKKNRDFIHNLVKCLSFERRKQKQLEKSYEILKQENDALRIKNEYLKLLNTKQLEQFSYQLDKGLKETKTVCKAKIMQIESQLHSEQEELKYYKKSEKKYLELVESETKQVKRLKEQLKLQKAREVEILKNFASVLNFLEDVKDTVNISDLGNESALKASGSIGDRENGSIREVLSSALTCGMESLNVRDLSILHDAIQELNERLCHRNELCGRNPMTNMSLTRLSMNYADQYDCCSDLDCPYQTSQDFANTSCLSLYPSRQKAETMQVHFQ